MLLGGCIANTWSVNILGIETSCDENAAAVVRDGRELLSNVVHSQIDLHKVYGGVVPEVAARSHIEVMIPVVEQALEQAFGQELRGGSLELGVGKTAPRIKTTNDKRQMTNQFDPWDQIDAIAVTKGPGLGGSLLIGVLTARTLALIKNKPLYGLNHVLGHVYANFIDFSQESMDAVTNAGNESHHHSTARGESRRQRFQSSLNVPPKHTSLRASTLPSASSTPMTLGSQPKKLKASDKRQMTIDKWRQPEFPLLALIVSGGHTQLALFKDHFDYKLLGQTQDDAVGEAFDKVAKVIGLEYPGGPSIQAAAQEGNIEAFKFPIARMDNKYDFSFSGLKTAVLRAVQELVGVGYDFPSFELKHKLSAAQVQDIAASFQYAAIKTLVDKTALAYKEFQPKTVVIAGGVAANTELRRQLSERLPLEINYAPISLCTDNAAMMAALGFYYIQNHEPDDAFSLEIEPSLVM